MKEFRSGLRVLCFRNADIAMMISAILRNSVCLSLRVPFFFDLFPRVKRFVVGISMRYAVLGNDILDDGQIRKIC